MAKKLFFSFFIIILFGTGCTTVSPEYKAISNINREVNSFPYVSDNVNYGTKEYLATPELFYENGGDCEDYSIAKYYELRRKGFLPEQLWIVMGIEDNEGHAVLLVNTEDETFVLDNKKNRVYPIRFSRLKPIYKINENSILGFKNNNFRSETFKATFSDDLYLDQIKNAFSGIKKEMKSKQYISNNKIKSQKTSHK